MGTLTKGLLPPVLALLAWEIIYRLGWIASESLSHPAAIFMALTGALADLTLLKATGQTLVAAGTGLLAGTAIGVTLGILTGSLPLARDLLRLTVEGLRPLPAAALMPVALLLFGFSYTMEASVVAFAVTWPMLLITAAAVQRIDPRQLDVARVLHLTRSQTIRHVVAPAVLTRVLDGLRLTGALSLVVAVTVEISVNPQGLGYLMVEAQQSFRPDLVLAALLWIGFVGLACNWALGPGSRT
jgi:ABC-type nitrate/sulfonate/bicarbonate transport system permease component